MRPIPGAPAGSTEHLIIPAPSSAAVVPTLSSEPRVLAYIEANPAKGHIGTLLLQVREDGSIQISSPYPITLPPPIARSFADHWMTPKLGVFRAEIGDVAVEAVRVDTLYSVSVIESGKRHVCHIGSYGSKTALAKLAPAMLRVAN